MNVMKFQILLGQGMSLSIITFIGFLVLFYGAGYGASGYLINDKRHYRYRNIGHFTQYLIGHVEKEDEWLDENKVELEYIMNNLRLKNGFARRSIKINLLSILLIAMLPNCLS